MQIIIDKIIYPGKSISRSNGKAVLTDEGLPGEVVEVKALKEKENYIEAETVRVIKASPHRISPRCSHYKICSPYQYIDYPEQIKIKKEQLEELFSHGLGLKNIEIAFKDSKDIWHYRNKIDVHVIWERGHPSFAYNKKESAKEFVPIDVCHLASLKINKLLASFIRIIKEKQLRFIEDVAAKESMTAGKMLLAVRTGRKIVPEKDFKQVAPLLDEFPAINGITLVQNKFLPSQIIGKGYITEEINGCLFYIGPDSFFQVNIPMLKQLVMDMESSMNFTKDEVLADLYCGVGTFGIIFAKRVAEAAGIESNPESINFLKGNIKANKVENYSLFNADSEKWLAANLRKRIDSLVLDPPRAGLGSGLCSLILKKKPSKIAYVSCDSASLIRDLKELLPIYKLQHVFAYDFFPHTPHIEILATLKSA